jgi:uncharacterized membrane protein YbhN (UPF0104 family)
MTVIAADLVEELPGAAAPAGGRANWKPVARQLLTVALLAGAAWAAYDHRAEISRAAGMLSQLNAGWVLVAITAEVASMVAFARLQRWLLRAGGVDIGLVPMVEIVLAGNALSSSLPGGPAWSATWAFRQLRRRGANRLLAGWVLLVAGVLAGLAVFVIVAAGAWVAGGTGPLAHLRWLAAALAAVPALVAGGWYAARRHPAVRAGLARSWQAVAGRYPRASAAGSFTARAVDNLGLVRPGVVGWMEAFGLALANWIYDAACLVACIAALGIPIPWRGVLAIYGLTQVSASLPITPGGLGVVEGSLAALLMAYGTPADSAVAVVLLYRIVSFWGLVPVGWGAWFGLEMAQRRGLRRRSHPWASHEHGSEPAPALAAVGPERILPPQPCAGCPGPVAHRPAPW